MDPSQMGAFSLHRSPQVVSRPHKSQEWEQMPVAAHHACFGCSPAGQMSAAFPSSLTS